MQFFFTRVGIQSVTKEACSSLVGIATDGAAVNIAGNGLKGLVERELEWIFWMWCLAHRLELAIKDALHGTWFDMLDEMLLRLYYVHLLQISKEMFRTGKHCHGPEGSIPPQ